MSTTRWMMTSIAKLQTQASELQAENERLLGMIADPKLISVAADERAIEVSIQPREEIMQHLFVMMARALGDSPNYIEADFGPDTKTGKTYTLTLKHYYGKTPGQVHQEEVAALKTRAIECEKIQAARYEEHLSIVHAQEDAIKKERDQAEQKYSDLIIHLCEIIESIRDHVSPKPNKDIP